MSTTQQNLLLFGGGDKPYSALQKFFDLAKMNQNLDQVTVISWASDQPLATQAEFLKDAEQIDCEGLQCSFELSAPVTLEEARQFEQRLWHSAGVFFSGGDQQKIMFTLNCYPFLAEAMHEQYEHGVVFGGTSAGTAIMSPQMICMDKDPTILCPTKVEVGLGLGLLKDTIVDQHFLKRQRQNRLFSLVLESPECLGLGVDEGAAFLVSNKRWGRVIGEGKVMIVDGRSIPGSLKVDILEHADRFDLKEHRKFIDDHTGEDSNLAPSVV